MACGKLVSGAVMVKMPEQCELIALGLWAAGTTNIKESKNQHRTHYSSETAADLDWYLCKKFEN